MLFSAIFLFTATCSTSSQNQSYDEYKLFNKAHCDLNMLIDEAPQLMDLFLSLLFCLWETVFDSFSIRKMGIFFKLSKCLWKKQEYVPKQVILHADVASLGEP